MHVWGGHTQSFFSACKIRWALKTLALLWIFKEPIYYWLACCGYGFLFGFFLVPCCLFLFLLQNRISVLSCPHIVVFIHQLSLDWLAVLKNCTKYDTHAVMRAGKGEVWWEGRKDGGQPEMSGRVDRNRGDREGQLGQKWRAQCIRMTDVWMLTETRVNKDICERWDWSHYWQAYLKHAQ